MCGSSIELNRINPSIACSPEWTSTNNLEKISVANVAMRSQRKRNLRDLKKSSVAREKSYSTRNLFSSLRAAKKHSVRQSFTSSSDVAKVFSENRATTAATSVNDLSSDVGQPGIMKIFGDEVSPGANYKSVMATQNSTAKELCKTALKRYGVSGKEGREFMMCEVLGKLSEKRVAARPLSFLKSKRKRNSKLGEL